MLREAEEEGALNIGMKYQRASIDVVEMKMLEKDIEEPKSQMQYLSKFYPCLYVGVLKKMHKNHRMQKYMNECK